VAVITGGSGGIGRACATALLARGYRVVLTARTAEPLRHAAEEIGAEWVAADAADETSFAEVVADLDRVDLLVHAAGILAGTFVRKESVATFDEVIRANLRSTFVATAGVLPKMGVGGRIIYISSTAGRRGMKGRTAYSASKGAMNAFAEGLRDEVARDGINVNVLVVAPVDTPMLEAVTFPMHTLQARDVADAVVFLDGLDPAVVLPEFEIRAADQGPLAAEPVRPAAYLDKQAGV
jgi:NAD(P)-dependent dehydrogenase (short-subunit alcohol dehydrogenase family)